VVRGISLAAGEALRNSVRHAGAAASRRVRITLADEQIRVSVSDDGVGFVRDPASPRLGIKGSIVDRMEELGGSATIDSAPNRGTEVILVVRPASSPGHTPDMVALTAADTGAGGLGTALARWAFVFVWATGILQVIVDGSLAAAPLEWGVALVAGLIGALLLTAPGPLPLPPSRVVWLPAISLLTAVVAFRTADSVGWVPALVFAAYLVAFLIPRGNAVAGCVGSALLIGSGLAWALPRWPRCSGSRSAASWQASSGGWWCATSSGASGRTAGRPPAPPSAPRWPRRRSRRPGPSWRPSRTSSVPFWSASPRASPSMRS
jgi:hypothetical protein